MYNLNILLTLILGIISPFEAQRRFVGNYQPGVQKNSILNNGNDTLLMKNNPRTGKLIFEDNFRTFDLKNWRHDITLGGGGNWEFQYYTNNRTTSYVKEGKLHIRPVLTSDQLGEAAVLNGGSIDLWGNMPNFQCTGNAWYGCQRSSNGDNILNPIQSALVRSVNKLSFTYGKVEVRAKLPKGDWIWPAIWLLPIDHAYGNWPASGEIDLVESRGNGPDYQFGGRDQVASTLHWGPSWEFNQYHKTTAAYKLKDGKDFSDDFHTFTLEWYEDSITTRIDGNIVLDLPIKESFWKKGEFPVGLNNPWSHQPKVAPFNKEFYIIMNVAVGGSQGYFPDGGKENKPWKNFSPSAMKDFYLAKDKWYPTWPDNDDRALIIDHVKVWSMDN